MQWQINGVDFVSIIVDTDSRKLDQSMKIKIGSFSYHVMIDNMCVAEAYYCNNNWLIYFSGNAQIQDCPDFITKNQDEIIPFLNKKYA